MTEITSARESRNQGQGRDQALSAAVKETPIPWVKLSTALGVRFCEAANTVLILPFMYKMVSEFDIVKNPKDISFYAGLLLASISFCQTLFVVHWGRLSDRIGRRPVLLMGLLGDTITIILFGFSKNFWWALATRSLNGICVGNSPVSKSVIAEIADSTNRTRMMSMQSLASNVGNALGAVIGGTFSNPVDKYPQIFGNSVLFKTYPYLLPCLISGSISLACFVIGFFKFEETLDKSHRVTPTTSRSSNQTNGVNESSRLLRSEEENTNVVTQQNKDITIRELLTPTVVNVLFTSLLSSAIILIAEHIYPIFAATPPSYGGLGLITNQIGHTYLVGAIVVVYLQLVAFPTWDKKYGTLACYKFGQQVMMLYSLLTPFLVPLARYIEKISDRLPPGSLVLSTFPKIPSTWDWVLVDTVILWVLLIILLAIQITGIVFTATGFNVIASNVAPSRAHLGLMNSVQHGVLSFSKIVGPLISGVVWAWSIKHDFSYPFNYHLTFVMCAAMAIYSLMLTSRLPESVNEFGPDRVVNSENGDRSETS